MQYKNMVAGTFLARPNRFIAHVQIGGQVEVCHVKNTGRCRELLPPGAEVWCQESDNPARKTKYDLITVRKGERLINMDSQAPNTAAGEWLRAGGLGEISGIRAEAVHGDSRFDFTFQKDGKTCFLEVKGVTLENDGVCAFPDVLYHAYLDMVDHLLGDDESHPVEELHTLPIASEHLHPFLARIISEERFILCDGMIRRRGEERGGER